MAAENIKGVSDAVGGAAGGKTEDPIEKYKDHFALSGKNCGSAKALLGKVTIVAFLVHDRTCAWKEEDVEALRGLMKSTCEKLMLSSKLSVNRLALTYAVDTVPIQFRFESANSAQVIADVMSQYGYESVAEYQKHYKSKFKKSEAPIVFFLHRDFRSFALRSETDNVTASEYSFVSYSDDLASCQRALMHELMHQFGAIDYYLPKTVKNAANTIFPESIMLHGWEVDELTRYVIGWDKKLSENAVKFLEETKDVTQEEIAEAYVENSDYDW